MNNRIWGLVLLISFSCPNPLRAQSVSWLGSFSAPGDSVGRTFGTPIGEPKVRGTLANGIDNVTQNMVNPGIGDMMGFLKSYKIKKSCEIEKTDCTLANKLDCDRITNSVMSGTVECWQGNSFYLHPLEGANKLPATRYEVVANLSPDSTGENLRVAKAASFSQPSLLDEAGQSLIDGQAMNCDSYQALGEDQVACVRGNQVFPMHLSDIRKSKKASVKLSDVTQAISIDLCGVTLDQPQSDSYLYDMKSFENLGPAIKRGARPRLDIYKKSSGIGATCQMPPSQQSCTNIYLTSSGLECVSYGRLVYKKDLETSPADLAKAAKKYLFGGKEIVSMNDLLNEALPSPNIHLRVERPDLLMQAPMISKSASAVEGIWRPRSSSQGSSQ